MPFGEAIRIALQSLRTNKLRSFLTVLGILIGVSSVVAVVAITGGLDRYMAERVLELGSKAFYVQKFPDLITSHEQFVEMMKRKNLTLDDMLAVKAFCTSCSAVGGQIATTQDAKYGRTTQEDVRVLGITENVPRIGSVRDLVAGRHLIEDDIDHARPVAVIGADLREAFFGSAEPLGKTIMVAGHPLRVVGVAEPKGSVFGESQDNFVWIPISAFEKLFGTRRSVTIQAEAASMALLERAQDEARLAMRVRRKLTYSEPDDFSIETGESVMNFWKSATQGIYVVTFVVTAISLIVGGIVVMNIMLVSVTERIREIGVRKALGARRRDILRQFLVESVILSAVGGLLGVLGAAAFALGLGHLLGNMMDAAFTTPIEPWAVALALVMSSLVGLVAGIYPAGRAAALDPVEALRNE
jgi:putative ABC transport system permease protein